MPHIIGVEQSALIGGRIIQGSVFITNEVVDDWRKNSIKGLVIKLDFEKAYDKVNWNYLLSMKKKFGFPQKCGRFEHAFNKAREPGLLKGVSIGPNRIIVSHLQFADDAVVFYEAEFTEVLNVRRILRCFELISGLKIHFHKSVLCGIGVDHDLTKSLADLLKCMVQSLPLNYLGMPLGASPRFRATWNLLLTSSRGN
ncbi:hypothetical protein Acr_18g0004050 [Actinidia rufa]|uniref:Reverse transcriptase domain-containing protein n=1 Tax=Actinidia rufa TaxID=165716 RepID=A0A7J0G615_9ERIC|nr:hypothetical protein Acr_18g0004050 [Actinidia rufa]